MIMYLGRSLKYPSDKCGPTEHSPRRILKLGTGALSLRCHLGHGDSFQACLSVSRTPPSHMPTQPLHQVTTGSPSTAAGPEAHALVMQHATGLEGS